MLFFVSIRSFLSYKYYAKFVKTFKKHPNKFDKRQCLGLLHNCAPNIEKHYSIGRFLKKVNILQVGTSKNSPNRLYSDTKKVKNV